MTKPVIDPIYQTEHFPRAGCKVCIEIPKETGGGFWVNVFAPGIEFPLACYLVLHPDDVPVAVAAVLTDGAHVPCKRSILPIADLLGFAGLCCRGE